MNDDELKKLLDTYLKKYKEKYTPETIKFLKDNFLTIRKSGEHIDVVSQIQVALNIMNPEDDVYKKYLKFLNNRYDLTKDILEVACGKFPALSKYIDEYQGSQKSGTITAYDPRLITTQYGNIKLFDRLFDEKTDVQNYSLITAMYPCEATVKIIEIANANNIDFSVLTCGCTHFSNEQFFYFRPSLERWQDYLYSVAKDTLPEGKILDIDFLGDDRIKTPIISTRKKTKTIPKTIKIHL